MNPTPVEDPKKPKTIEREKISELYRLVEFGRLSSGIFHDLINPLTTVCLSVEKLRKQSHGVDHESCGEIERAVRASKRIESFIRTVRKQLSCEGKKEIFAVKSEVYEAIDLLLYKSRISGVEVRAVIGDTTFIYGNSVRFFQIAANLISNAIDSYAHKSLEDKNNKVVLLSISKDDECVRLVVKDFGCGMPIAMHKAIFDPFFTTKSRHMGMGLGLSTTKGIVEDDFGGTIDVESSPNKGSTFTVTIPLERKAEISRRVELETAAKS